MAPLILLAMAAIASVRGEAPVYPQVRFQPLKNVLVLPSSQQLKQLSENATKQQDTKPKDVKPEEDKAVSMDELKRAEGAVTGSYHVLLENGRLQKVDYTAAPRLPVQQQIKQEPEIRSWYYTQVPADVLQRYYSEYYAQQQQNAEYRKPGSTNQASNSNSQGFSQSGTHGVNQASNHNVQVFNQGKKGALLVSSYDSAATQQQFQRADAPLQGHSAQNNARHLNAASSNSNFASVSSSSHQVTGSSAPNSVSSQQRIRSGDEVETFEPVQGRTEQRDQQGFPPSGVVATIYYSDVSPITGPIYTFEQTPLIRVLRQA